MNDNNSLAKPALQEIELQNIFSFRSVKIALSGLNVLVGPNGAGKSNILKVISFIGAIARSDLIPAIERFGGFERLYFNGERKQPTVKVKFKLLVTKYASANAPDEYVLSFSRGQRANRRHYVYQRYETLAFKRYKGAGRRITVKGGNIYIQEDQGDKAKKKPESVTIGADSTGLATIRRLGEMYGAEQVDEIATLFETFRVFEIDAKRAIQPTLLGRKLNILQPNGGNLAGYLKYLQLEHPELLEAISEDLAAVSPSVSGLRVRQYGAGVDEGFVVELIERGLTEPTPLAAASFGTIRALALLAMLHDPYPPRLTCIEEIDHGLHPHALDRLVERLRDASKRTQIIAVTHSPALLNRLDPSELIVFERNAVTGETSIPKISPLDIRRAEEETGLGLGEMWFSGALGGVPQ